MKPICDDRATPPPPGDSPELHTVCCSLPSNTMSAVCVTMCGPVCICESGVWTRSRQRWQTGCCSVWFRSDLCSRRSWFCSVLFGSVRFCCCCGGEIKNPARVEGTSIGSRPASLRSVSQLCPRWRPAAGTGAARPGQVSSHAHTHAHRWSTSVPPRARHSCFSFVNWLRHVMFPSLSSSSSSSSSSSTTTTRLVSWNLASWRRWRRGKRPGVLMILNQSYKIKASPLRLRTSPFYCVDAGEASSPLCHAAALIQLLSNICTLRSSITSSRCSRCFSVNMCCFYWSQTPIRLSQGCWDVGAWMHVQEKSN